MGNNLLCYQNCIYNTTYKHTLIHKCNISFIIDTINTQKELDNNISLAYTNENNSKHNHNPNITTHNHTTYHI